MTAWSAATLTLKIARLTGSAGSPSPSASSEVAEPPGTPAHPLQASSNPRRTAEDTRGLALRFPIPKGLPWLDTLSVSTDEGKPMIANCPLSSLTTSSRRTFCGRRGLRRGDGIEPQRRQWGRYATAFLGRRHFDDPDPIEQRFRSSSREEAQHPLVAQPPRVVSRS